MRFFNLKYQELLLIPLCLVVATWTVSCEKEEDSPIDEAEDLCPDDPNKTRPGVCGCGVTDVLNAITGVYTCMTDIVDFCPNDPDKTSPGTCGCGVADTKGADGIPLCLTQNIDLCPSDPLKTLPGICGCGVADDANDGTGIPPCLKEKFDLCPLNPDKTSPGVCGCDVADTLDPDTGIPGCIVDSIDFCPNDPDKTAPGTCGCGVADEDSDGDGILDCVDKCPEDPLKIEPGTCGCGVADSRENLADNDRDGIPNCIDFCPDNPYKQTDDGCSCNELSAVSGTQTVCATMIDSARTFVALRDAWNSADPDTTQIPAFILVDDINLAEDETNAATDWVGWGSAETPFTAIFFGNNHAISAVVQTASTQRQLTLGNESNSDVALFAHTLGAQIRDLKADLSFTGNDFVAPLIAHAQKTTVSNIQMTSRVSAQSNGSGLVADAENSTFTQISAQGSVSSGLNASCIVSQARNIQLSQARAGCTVSGNEYAAGVVSRLSSSSKLVDIYANATVSGSTYASGMIADMTAHSGLLNSYTTSQVTCNAGPCALIAAYANEFITIKNVYAAGNIIDNRPTMLEEPESPSNGEKDSERHPSGEENSPPGGQAPKNDGVTPSDGTENPGPGTDSESGDSEPGVAPNAQIPLAMAVASFASADSVLSSVYYWGETQIPPIPEAADMPGVDSPVAFSFNKLRPYTADSLYLLDLLNDAMICTGSDCTIDANACTPWTVGTLTLTSPDSGAVMSVSIPQLRF